MSSQFLGVATDDNFEGEVLKSEKPVLIDFWAPWCGPCKAIGPIVEEVAAQYSDKIKVMKLNVDDSQKSAVAYGVRSIPTLMVFKNGKVADTLIGLVAKDKIEALINKSLQRPESIRGENLDFHKNQTGRMVKLKYIGVVIGLLLIFSGCSFDKSSLLKGNIFEFFSKKEPVRTTPEGLYARGTKEYQNGSYKKAREVYTRLKEEYPLHELAVLAELGIADSFYSDKEYGEAEVAYRDFSTLFPTNENVPYAIYQMGMCHFVQIEAIDRDQTQTIKARREFERLMARFPQSKFFLLAEKQVRECKTKLAEHEFYIGDFYFKQKKYEAALNRFEGIARDYAGVGMDMKVAYYIAETKARLAEQEKEKKLKEEKERAKAKAKEEAKAKKASSKP